MICRAVRSESSKTLSSSRRFCADSRLASDEASSSRSSSSSWASSASATGWMPKMARNPFAALLSTKMAG